MALQNLLGDIALDSSVQQVKTSVDGVTAALNDGVQITGAVPLPDGAATQATLEAVQALTEQVATLTETLNIFVSQMLRMAPKKDQLDRSVVYVESISSSTIIGTVSNITSLGGQPANTLVYPLSTPVHLYNKIEVS